MKQWAVSSLAILASLALLVPSAFAAPGDVHGAAGVAVRARLVHASALPHAAPGGAGPSRFHAEGVFEEAEREIEALKRNPRALGPNDFAQTTLDRSPGVFAPLGTQAPTIGNGFEGITKHGYVPGEPTVAAGPLGVFSTGNVTVVFTDKDGGNRVEVDGKTFFGVPVSEGAISDAQCFYDALRGRFLALAFTTSYGGTGGPYSFFYLAVSQTSDARGFWYVYRFDQMLDGSTPTAFWSDYEGLGVSDDKIAMSSQQYSFSGVYQYQKMRVIDRALAYSGGPVPYVDFANFPAPPGGNTGDNFVTKPARNLTAGDATIHCLNVRVGSGSRVTYRTITGPPSAPVLSAGAFVTVSSYAAPPDAVQKGSATLVPTNDCRPTDFYVRNGVLICSWHTAANFGGSTVSAIRLFLMRTSDQAVITDETYGASGVFYYYPAVTMDSVGTIFLGFDRSSSTEFPSSWATAKRRTEPSLEPSALLKTGLASESEGRWGDYTGIDMDESLCGPSGSTAWYAGQWTKSAALFATWITRLSVTYGVIAGSVLDDCDGATGTAADRGPLAGVPLALKQGSTTLATTSTDATGAYSFGYLETGVYDVVVTAPGGGLALDALPGSGGNAQAKVSATDLQVDLTNAQGSSGNTFLVTTSHPVPATAGITPPSRTAGSGLFTLTVNGSSLTRCAVVRLDGADRATTWVSASQVTAQIPASDQTAPGTHAITVFNPAAGGGTSNGQTLTITADTTPPVVAVTSPNGGETWKGGSQHAVTWTATDDVAVTTVDLAWSADGGASFPGAIATGIANTGTYSWTVADAPSTGARVRVIAHDAAGNAGRDSSDASFTIDRWIITATAGAGGSVSPSGAVGVAEGASQAFTITPDGGSHVADVLVDGVSVGPVVSHTFTNVTASHTLAASFATSARTLTTTVVGGGAVTRMPDLATYDLGTTVTLAAIPDSGWAFTGWSGDTTTTNDTVAVFISGDRSLTATFVDVAPPVATVLSPNGGGALLLGSSAPLTWSALDNAAVTAVDLLLSRTGAGGPFDSVATGIANSGTYSWTVTTPATANAYLKVVAHDAAGNTAFDLSDTSFAIAGPGGVENGPVTGFELGPIRPNPARLSAHVGFALPERARVRVSVIDVQGREVAVLADGDYDPGRHDVTWQPGSLGGAPVGLYFVRMSAPGRTLVRRLAMLR